MKLVQSYFPEISQASIKKLVEFQELLLDWNQKVNVISRKDEENFEERHVLHSLAIQQIVNFRKNSSVVDIGTGGGFPGLPLAIVNPTVNFTLVDSIGKKIALVKDIAHELGLKNVTAVNARAEDLADKIIVLDKGDIVEIGTHQELMEKGGVYKELSSLQNNYTEEEVLR